MFEAGVSKIIPFGSESNLASYDVFTFRFVIQKNMINDSI